MHRKIWWLSTGAVLTCLALSSYLLSSGSAEGKKDKGAAQKTQKVGKIKPPPRTVQFKKPRIQPALVVASNFIRVNQARDQYHVNGAELTAAVLDTGLRSTHKDFTGRVIAGKNFTEEGGGEDDTSDLDGHGTNVSGIIAAGGKPMGIHLGMAPGAKIVPLKVLTKTGGDFGAVVKALQWVLDHRQDHNISVVNMSLGDQANYADDSGFTDDAAKVQELIKKLRDQKVAVVVAAGNGYFTFSPEGMPAKQGMGFPGIVRETVSVGAVYDRDDNVPIEYYDGAIAYKQKPGAITPFSQRLHASANKDCRTDVFAPGAPIISTGNESDEGESIESGTSQASPVVAGTILLIQQYYVRTNGHMPTVDQIEEILRTGGITIKDGSLENDNVAHTNLEYPRIDALNALGVAQHDLIREHLLKADILKAPKVRNK